MTSVEEKVYWSKLFEAYQSLLTAKQREYFDQTINEDLSLQELAENFHVSRAAIHDANRKTEQLLENFETKLQLVAKREALSEILVQAENHDLNLDEMVRAIKKVM